MPDAEPLPSNSQKPASDRRGPDSIEALSQRLHEIRDRFPACDVTAVSEVVRAVLATMTGHLSEAEMSLLAEINELGQTVARARSEIAAMQVEDITASHIPAASDELDAILTHTAAATNTILEECESLDALALALECPVRSGATRAAAAAALRTATMRIYEACGFQDLTGQRISKVVAALQAIDRRVACILQTSAAQERARGPVRAGTALSDGSSDDPLATEFLCGPQLPAEAMGQDEIDMLLATL